MIMQSAICLLASFLATIGGGYFVGKTLKNVAGEMPNTGLDGGGRIIGCLERIAIVSFVLIGEYQPIGFLLAAKSILRFPEISKEPSNSRALAEYVIIGTMLSLVVGLGIGWAGRCAIQWVSLR